MFLRQIFHALFHKQLQTQLQLGLEVQGLPSSWRGGGVNLWVVLFDQRIYLLISHFRHPLPPRRCPSVSLIKDNCPQTGIHTRETTQMWHAYMHLQNMTALSSLLNSRGGCLLPIPTCRSSLPDWTVLINCQLDWLQIFIICDDWANLDSNLNQGC